MTIRQFIEHRVQQLNGPASKWTDVITRRIRSNPALKVCELAKIANRHPSWFGEAYKRATGERLLETAARLCVEYAACMLRETDQSYAGIAAEAGFCDQSHMNRTFRRMLGRLPSEVREDRAMLRRLSVSFAT
jgi:transcriptional regulator GlxA family with amidase domain